MTSLPPIESVYYDAEIETMPRARLEELQLERLLDLLPLAYERPLIREAWDAAGVHPRDIRTLDDFRERVPFIDKDAVRRFRQRARRSLRRAAVRRPRAADRRELDVGHDRRSDARTRAVGRRRAHVARDHHA